MKLLLIYDKENTGFIDQDVSCSPTSSVFRVTGLKILNRVGTIFLSIFFLEKIKFHAF